ncbi:unnamed protein product [Symbiodinium sp. CCMP2592]|nr:unnamed protein product [Symbiodinium sp. CCMP2592]
MIYCMDCAESAPMLSRALAKSLEEPELTIDAGLARIFLISDILHNSALSSSRGATRYRSNLQELLPGACEQFGFWLRGKGRQSLRQSRSEAAVRQVLDCWRDWSIFPPLFPAGLEALLFAEIPEDTDTKAKGDQDLELQAKLAHWRDPGTAPRAPYAARLRGLANSTLPVAACVLRLCHFERFWHTADPARRQRAGIRSPGEGEKACLQKEWDGESLSEDDELDADGESFSEAAWPMLGLTQWPHGIGMDPGRRHASARAGGEKELGSAGCEEKSTRNHFNIGQSTGIRILQCRHVLRSCYVGDICAQIRRKDRSKRPQAGSRRCSGVTYSAWRLDMYICGYVCTALRTMYCSLAWCTKTGQVLHGCHRTSSAAVGIFLVLSVYVSKSVGSRHASMYIWCVVHM